MQSDDYRTIFEYNYKGNKMNKIITVMLVIAALCTFSGCKNRDVMKQDKTEWDYEKYMVESYYQTNAGHYDKAIGLLTEAMIKFPDDDILGLIYNIGYNCYQKKDYPEAQGYFNRVIKMYEDQIGALDESGEYRKYVILSTSMLAKIDADKEDAKDPYHIKDDLAQRKKLRPKPNSAEKNDN